MKLKNSHLDETSRYRRKMLHSITRKKRLKQITYWTMVVLATLILIALAYSYSTPL